MPIRITVRVDNSKICGKPLPSLRLLGQERPGLFACVLLAVISSQQDSCGQRDTTLLAVINLPRRTHACVLSAPRVHQRFERVRREPVSDHFGGESLLDGGFDQRPGDSGDRFTGSAQVSGCGEQALGRRSTA